MRNAFRPRTLFELRDAFEIARDDPEVGVIVFTGEGPDAFCSGGDQRVRGDDGYRDDQGIGRLNVLDLQVQIRRLPKPVVAMVAGYAIGGGHVLHVVCDLTIAADNARFGQTGPQVGSFDGGFGSGLLARIVGQKKAREIWYLCEQYDAQAALDMGLVNTVVPLADLEIETVAWARKMLQHSPLALRMLKASMNAADDGLAGIQQLAGDATLLYYMTEEAQEGKNAYLEKRRPEFEQIPQAPVTTARLWYQGARPKTLGAAFSPVLVGTAAGSLDGPINWPRAAAAAVVALALQVGVNYANDYSDGVRGTDAQRRGPVRLTATGLATPRSVRTAAAARVRGRRGRRRRAVARREPVAAARRRGRDRRGGHLHRRPEAVRLHRARRGDGARLLRVRRDRRQRVRAARRASRCRVGGCARGRAARRAASCSRTTSATSTPTGSPASARSRCASAPPGRAACTSRASSARSSPSSRAARSSPSALLAVVALPLAIAPVRAMLTRHDPPGLIAALVGTVRFQLVLSALLAIGLWAG